MKTFYEFLMTFRHEKLQSNIGRLADWIFYDAAFPKQAVDYLELSNYLENTLPYIGALQTFDEVWSEYEEKYKQDSF